jgi:kinesin family protein C1
MANREMEDELGQANQKKGMKISDPFQQRLEALRSRKAARQQPAALHPRQPSRDISGLSRRFGNLSLDEGSEKKSGGGQVVSHQYKQQPLSGLSQSDVQAESITPSKVRQREAARCNPLGPANSQGPPAPVPATPPQSKTFNVALDTVNRLLGSHQKGPFSASKSGSPTKPSFLVKDSNVTNFTGWDVDGRLNEFESQFKVMKEAFDVTMTDRKALEEAIDLAKNRGM